MISVKTHLRTYKITFVVNNGKRYLLYNEGRKEKYIELYTKEVNDNERLRIFCEDSCGEPRD